MTAFSCKCFLLVLNVKLIKRSLEKINGLFYKQEYLCLAKESFLHPLHAYLVQDNLVVVDVTKLHSFVGYSPLVFAIYPMPQTVLQHEYITVIFSQNVLSNNVAFSRRDVCATLFFKKSEVKRSDRAHLVFIKALRDGTVSFRPFTSSLLTSVTACIIVNKEMCS